VPEGDVEPGGGVAGMRRRGTLENDGKDGGAETRLRSVEWCGEHAGVGDLRIVEADVGGRHAEMVTVPRPNPRATRMPRPRPDMRPPGLARIE
jgi:hypothetical protein